MSEEQPEMMDVDLDGGVTVSMTKENGQKYIDARNIKTKAFNDLQSQNAAKETAEQQAAADLKAAEEKRVALEAASKGQIDQLTNIHASELALRDQENLTLSIRSQLAVSTDIIASAVPDVTTLLASQFSKADDGTYKTATGQTLSEMLPGYLEANPHFKASAIPRKVSGEGDAIIPAGVETITIAEYNKNPKKYASQIEQRKMIIKG